MNNNVVFLASSQDYPYKFTAQNTKTELMASGLILCADTITIVNTTKGSKDFKKVNHGNKGGIKHISFPFRLNGFFSIFLNSFNFIKVLRYCRKDKMNNTAIIGHDYLLVYLFMVISARFLGYKIVLVVNEWRMYLSDLNRFQKIDYYLYHKISGHFVDGIFPISSYLETKTSIFKKPSLKVPVLADFERIKPIVDFEKSNYFLYCANAGYFRIIELLIESLGLLAKEGYLTTFKFVLHGTKAELDKVNEYINGKNLSKSIVILTKIPYDQLLQEYQKALALLIPLDDGMQDVARFPQKIAEYCSTGGPIITGAVGEIPLYFKADINAFISNDLSAKGYAAQMKKVLENPDEAIKVGLKGRLLGESKFNYVSVGQEMHEFLNSLFE